VRPTRSVLAPILFVSVVIVAPAARAVEPIVVIAPFNLTGPDSVLDAPCYHGAELAVEKLNGEGGILGRPMRLIEVDTASDVGGTADKVRVALENHPDAVAGVGFAYSTYALEAGRVLQKAGTPFITPGATAPDLPREVGDDLFLAAYGDDAQARVMAKYAWHELGIRRVALWIDESRVYTRTVGAYFDQFFRALGGSVEKRTYPGDTTDFRGLIAAVKSAEQSPQAIYAASMPGSAVTLIEQVRKAGIDLPLLSADGWADKRIVDASGRQGIKNIYFTTHRFLGVETPAMKAFVDAYRRKFGATPPDAFAPLGFDSVNLLADAIKRAGSAEPAKVRASLADTRDFRGLVGKISYAPGTRVPKKAVAVIRIDKGIEAPVWTWTPAGQ
jgi:branched-chain amino acid transport system substrate-binding protein